MAAINSDAPPSESPALVAPVPRYANGHAGDLTQYSSNRSGQTTSSSAAAVVDPSSSTITDADGGKRNGARQHGDDGVTQYMSVLPRQGNPEDAQAALDKLDRMKRTKESKHRWMTGTGVAGLMHVARAGGKEERKEKRRQHREDKRNDDDAASIGSSTSSRNLYGEVKLAISSMPAFNVLSTKAAAARRERADSPAPDEAQQQDRSLRDNLPFRFGSSRRRSSLVPLSADTLSPSMPPAQSHHALRSVVDAQTDSVPNAPAATTQESNAAATSVSKPIMPTSDLNPLKEERRIEEATDVLTTDAAPPHTTELIKPKAERPRLMLQTPSQTGKLSLASMMQSPTEMDTPSGSLRDALLRTDAAPLPGLPDRQQTTPGPCDGDALTAAEQCRKDMSRPTMLEESIMDDLATSIGSPSSVGSGSDSDAEDSTDLDESIEQMGPLNLNHGTELTRKEKKKLVRRMRRERKRNGVQPSGTAPKRAMTAYQDDAVVPPPPSSSANSRTHHRKSSLTNHISTGLHYASSQSRNRRAIERYSPHPSRPGSAKPFQGGAGMTALSSSSAATPPFGPTGINGGSISRSSTPAHVLNSERSSFSAEDSGRDVMGVGMSNSRPNSVRAGEEGEEVEEERMRGNLLKRWGTGQSVASTLAPSGSIKGSLLKNRIMSLRRSRKQPSDVQEEEQDATPRHERDAEQELDKALGRLVAQEAPDELGEQYEYDVLYENQRGMMVFGVPKFSAKTLFQWDPTPWTNARYGNSAYNVVNAQLPNPSWEWVHREWMIDMSGDVDESGWQYSYNFGRLALPIFTRPAQTMPRANAEGNKVTNERFGKAMERMERREEKASHREDDGLEALKRSAITRQAKWSGIPTQNTYVRRRRWIRLRRKKPIVVASSGDTPKPGTPAGLSKSSGDWLQLVKDEKAAAAAKQVRSDGSDDSDDGSGLSDVEEGTSSSSSDGEEAKGGESDFLARRVYGEMKSGADPLEQRASKERMRRRRHAREFTGTIRELKSLLPTILDRRSGRAHRVKTGATDRQKSLWLAEIDARNPFISWLYVKRRLDDDDLAFATTSLRVRERRNAKRAAKRTGSRDASMQDLNGRPASTVSLPTWDQFELTKDAMVEINFRRVLRVLKACKLDRQKLQLWRVWLGADPLNVETSRNEDLLDLGLAASEAAASQSLLRAKAELTRSAKTRWRNAYTPADAMDVWDVVERRLDRLLLIFEYQSSRAAFLRLLLTLHATSHAAHRFRPTPLRIGTGEGTTTSPTQEAEVPATLAPDASGRNTFDGAAGDEWRVARVPRLEFWSDLIGCARAVVSSTSSPKLGSNGIMRSAGEYGGFSAPSSPVMEQQRIGSPLGRSRTPVSVSGWSFAMSPLGRSSPPPSLSGRRGSSVVGSPSIAQLERAGSPKSRPTSTFPGSAAEWTGFGGSPSIHSINHRSNSSAGNRAAATATGGSPHLQPPTATRHTPSPTPSGMSESDQVFLAQLLQVPVERQRDILLQSCGSVFETKAQAQTTDHFLGSSSSSVRGAEAPTPSQRDVGDKSTAAGLRTQSTHVREDSELVRRLSAALDEEGAGEE